MRASGTGHVQTIVHDQSRASPAHGLDTLPRQVGQLTIVEPAFTKLYQVNSGARGGANPLDERRAIAAGRHLTVCDHADDRPHGAFSLRRRTNRGGT